MTKELQNIEKKAQYIREKVLEHCVKAKTGHVTSSFSSAEILAVLYYGGILRFEPKDPDWNGRDRFILSKAQASPALYTILGDLGFFDPNEMEKFAQKDGMFGVHLQNTVPGVEITSGSLGHGLGLACGVALAAKLNKELFMTVVLMGDGELHEGSCWESIMFASHNRLNNMVVIVDRNYQCATDFVEEIVALEPIDRKWESFGWEVKRVDGHSVSALTQALVGFRSRRSTKPLVIIADTIKGKGCDFMCSVPLWHGIAPKGSDAEKAREELRRSKA